MCKFKKEKVLPILAMLMVVIALCLGVGSYFRALAADINVDKDMLSVKCQIAENTNKNTVSLRMVSSIDSLNYRRVGFEVYILNDAGDAVEKKFERTMTEVFSKIETKTRGLDYVFSPQIFDVDSNYFITYTLTGFSEEYFDNGILIKPFVVAKGDTSETRVYGRSRYTTIADMKEENSLYIAVENETLVADDKENWTVTAGETTYTTAGQVDVNITSGDYLVADSEYTHVKVEVSPTSLSSVTTFEVSDGENEVSVLHRNLYYTPNADGSITPDTTWYTETTTGSKYVIVTSADLYGLAAMTDGVANTDGTSDLNFNGRTIYLANDITVNSSDAMQAAIAQIEAGETVTEVYAWTPIGASQQFNGTFLGQEHTISGLYYNDSTKQNVGLFGLSNTSSQIQDLRLKDSYFSGKEQVGSIVGKGGGKFSNIYSNATVVSANGKAGGLIGYVSNTATNTVNGCWFDGDLTIKLATGPQHGGGIVGSVASSGTLTISNCLNTGSVTSSRTSSGANFAGGIIGSQQETATLYIKQCLSTGVVSNSSNVTVGLSDILGGVNGSVTVEITDTYTTQEFGRIYLNSNATLNYKINSQDVKLSSNNSIDSTSVVTPIISVADITDDTATTQSTLSGFDFTTEWTAKESYYPIPTGLADLAGLYPVVNYDLIYNFELMNNFKNDYASQDGGYDAVWENYISQLKDTDVDMITLTPGIYRTNLWQSDVDTHWTDYALTQDETDFAIYERAKAYMLAGGDPFEEMLDYCEKYGYDVYVNYRMNDQHYTSDSTFATHNQFYLACLDNGYVLNQNSGSDNQTLNYAVEEVRQYYFDILEELCTNYDVDGLELDFERAPIFFDAETLAADTDGDGTNDGVEIMTEFVASVRTMLNEVGEKKDKYLPLSVRVCDSLDESLSVGLDVKNWVELGYVDIVNATSSYFQTMSVDVDSYKNAIGDNARLYAELHYVTDQYSEDKYKRVYSTAENLKSVAESYLSRGVDGISAFNMDYSANIEQTLSGLKGITDTETLKKSEKHYVLRRGYDFSTSDFTSAGTITAVIPVDNTDELFESALLRLETDADSTEAEYEVSFNGTTLEATTNEMLTDGTELFPRLDKSTDNIAYATVERLKYYVVPLDIIVNGENTITITQTSGDACTIRMIEVAVYHEDSYALQGLKEEESDSSALNPKVFDKTYNYDNYTTVIASENFEEAEADSTYSDSTKWTLTNKTPGSMTVKSETGNQYVLVSSKSTGFDQRFATKTFDDTDESILVSFKYRNMTGGQFGLYASGKNDSESVSNAITVYIYSNGKIKNNVSGTWNDLSETITTTEDEWTEISALFVTKQNVIHFYANGEYLGSSDYRASVTELSGIWIGYQSGTGDSLYSVEMDDIEIVNMGSDYDTWYHFVETDRLSFDYDAENNADGSNISPLTLDNTVADSSLSSAEITSDGTLKMLSTTATNGASKHYKYTLNSAISTDYAKMSLKYKIEDDDNNSRIDIYMNNTNVGNVSIYKNKITSTYLTGNGSSAIVMSDIADTGDGWHTLDIIFDFVEKTLQYVIDGTVASTISDKPIYFRSNTATSLPHIYLRYMTTDSSDAAYIDDVVFYKDGTQYFAPKLSSDTVTIDNANQVITMAESVVESLSNMEDIADAISSDKKCTYVVIDTDEDGVFSDGDVLEVTVTDTGITYQYTIDVVNNLDTEVQAFIVTGLDEQGDDFCRVDTVTKAGDALIEVRVTNNTAETVTPVIVAEVYNDSDELLSSETVNTVSIESQSTEDIEVTATVPASAENGTIKIKFLDSLENVLAKELKYTVATNDFVVPNVISDNMVLQRNSTVNIFGKAPAGATVTATLADGTTGSYTVPDESNEFFVELKLGDYTTEGQTLTISAVDEENTELGTVTRTGVLIGDVYYGGGQSNMTRTFAATANDIGNGLCSNYTADDKAQFVTDYEALGDTLKNVRFFAASADSYKSRDQYTDAELASKESWKLVNSSTIGQTYEVIVRMAGQIQSLSDVNSEVPIGIICCAQGGTKLAKWVSRDTVLDFDTTEVNEYESNFTNASDTERWAGHTDLYYDAVRTVMPYTVKAAVWYQGESDTSTNYDKYLKAMIDEFREGMRNNMPYYIIQLPGYVSGTWTEGTNTTSEIMAVRRLLQWNAQQQLTDVHLVVTNDTGDNTNIHPANKIVVGERLARTVLATAFSEDIAYTGPTYVSATYDTGSATITVETYNGTLSKYDTTVGSKIFQLTDGTNWYTADSIDVSGNTITVKNSTMTATATGVRYAYCPEIVQCIYTSYEDGKLELPLAPFNTAYVFNKFE